MLLAVGILHPASYGKRVNTDIPSYPKPMIVEKEDFFMQKTNKQAVPVRQGRIAVFGSLKALVAASLLAAMSIVCGKYLAFGVGNVLRFSLENLPIILAGMFFGPAIGATVGAVADIIGCLLVGYTLNPIITLGAAAAGFVGGAVYRLTKRHTHLCHGLCVCLSTVASHICGSVLIKTFGLSAFYDMPFTLLLLWRLANYLIIGAIETALLYFITRSKAVTAALGSTR